MLNHAKGIRFLVLCFTMILACGAVAVSAAEPVVYADGVGGSAEHYATLSEAVNALPQTGGVVVVSGKVTVGNAEKLSSKLITVTSKYGSVDATQGSLVLDGTLTLGADTVFENVTIVGSGKILAAGNRLTVKASVKTESKNGTYPSIFGGSDAALSANSNLSLAGGTWKLICGGNAAGDFTGNSNVTVTGGTITDALIGGNGPDGGNYTGNVELSMLGGKLNYNANGAGLVGGSVGKSGGATVLFDGNINVTVAGTAEVVNTILGSSRYTTAKTNGDIHITIGGNAKIGRHLYGAGYGNVTTRANGIIVDIGESATFVAPAGSSSFICTGANSSSVVGNLTMNIRDGVSIPGNIYGGGYAGNVTGDSVVNLYNGEIKVYLSAGSRGGTVTGNTTVNAYGGKVGYYSSTTVYHITGHGGDNGKVTGTATVVLDGTDVAGNILTKNGTPNFILKSGNVTAVTSPAKIDLSAGGTLTLGSTVNVTEILGGGKIILPATASIVVDKLTGTLSLVVLGTVNDGQTVLTVKDKTSTGVVKGTLTGASLEKKDDAVGTVYYAAVEGGNAMTHVTIKYYDPEGKSQPKMRLYSGINKDENKTLLYTGTDGVPYEADLAPGYYFIRVYYNESSDYWGKNIYIDGTEKTKTYDFPFSQTKSNSYIENVMMHTTDQVLENFYQTDTLDGYVAQDTPTFTLHKDDRAFMSAAELSAYVHDLEKKCSYLYLFEAALENESNTMPILIFTKDKIPEGASLEEIGAIVRMGGTREILMISGGLHGNEPAGVEGVLGLACDLAGEYGKTVLDRFGAIVLIPASSPENLMRFQRNYRDGANPNRDFTSALHSNTQMIDYVYTQFMPTVYIDCHEDTSGTNAVNPADYSHANIDDVCFDIAGVPNAPLVDSNGIAAGTSKLLQNKAYTVLLPQMLDRTAACGLRTGNYEWAYYCCGMSQNYASIRGSYGILIEVMRIWSGKSHYARAVFAMRHALETTIEIIMEQNGQLARDVAAARSAAAVKVFDPANIFVTAMSKGASGLSLKRIHPSVYLDGTYKNEKEMVTREKYDTVTASRPMPTGYVLSADAAHFDDVLKKLDQHGIKYSMLEKGTTLTLRRYTIAASATYGDAEEVTLNAGGVAVSTDTSDAYLVAYLFEPDSYTSNDVKASLYQMGLIAATDALYRSESNDFRFIDHSHSLNHVDAIPGDCITESEVEHYHCDSCGKDFSDAAGTTELIDLKGVKDPENHVGGNLNYNETDHWVDCACGTELNTEAHTFADGVCTVCGYVIAPALGHTHSMTKVDAKPMTCTGDGNIEYYKCDGCGKLFMDAAGNVETTADEVVDKATGHDYEWIVDKEATATEKGSKHEECKVCHDKKDPVEIPETGTAMDPTKPENPDSPQTGDNSLMFLWIALLFLPGVGVAGSAIYSRKKKYSAK